MVGLEELRGEENAVAASLADCIARISVSKDETSFEVLFRISRHG